MHPISRFPYRESQDIQKQSKAKYQLKVTKNTYASRMQPIDPLILAYVKALTDGQTDCALLIARLIVANL